MTFQEWLDEDDRRLPALIFLGVLAALTLITGILAFKPLFDP